MAGKQTQRWDLSVDGHDHHVEVEGSFSRAIRWHVDGDLVATKKTADDNVSLDAEPDSGHAIRLTFSALGHPNRVTLFEGDDRMTAKARAATGTGGLDLDPEPGSPALAGSPRR